MLLEIEKLTLRRGHRFVLTIDRFSLEAGERVAVIGANGSGKSTLLRLLALLEEPTSHERFRFRQQAATRSMGGLKEIGLLRQDALLFRGTVRQNLAYPLKLRRVSGSEATSRIAETLELLDLAEHADSRVDRLSGGEQRRVALGRVLIGCPELLLLDEPTAHLDRPSANVIERVLSEWNTGLLVATHDLHLAHRVATRVLNLKDGRITPGLPENVLAGQLQDGTLVTRRGLRIALPDAVDRTEAAQTATAIVDPRALVLSLEAVPSSMRNRFNGHVSSVREENGNVWIEIECGERLTSIISRDAYEKLGINVNRPVVVSFTASAVELL